MSRRPLPFQIAGAAPPDAFPPDACALAHPNGLIAVGGDLSPARLLAAYRRGIFPWYEEGQPILWWTPDPRLVLDPRRFHLSRSLRRTINRQRFEIRVDTAFAKVIGACAQPRRDGTGTWLTAEMRRAYERLAALGHAHSIEAWRHGSLAGGVYGIALGRAFFGESMFSREADASKVALHALCERLAPCPGALLDCQVPSPHLIALGAELLPRSVFLERLAPALAAAGPWGRGANAPAPRVPPQNR